MRLLVICLFIVFFTQVSSATKSSNHTIQHMEIMPLEFTENQGQWDAEVSFQANAGGATMWFPHSEDLNLGGIRTSPTSSLGIYKSNGFGKFSISPSYAIDQLEPKYILAGDLDGDGDPDLVSTFHDDDQAIGVHPNNPSGDDCGTSIFVNLPADLPYTDNNFTCGRGDEVNSTCLNDWDNGEDIFYQLSITTSMAIDILLDPLGAAWTSIVLDDQCPPALDCIDESRASSPTPHGFTAVLEPGTYYLMVDGYPPPDCIPSFNLSIRESLPYICGDANGDGAPNVGDAVYLINYVFKGGPAPDPLEAGDANCDGSSNVGDAVYLINFVFKGGPQPCASCP